MKQLPGFTGYEGPVVGAEFKWRNEPMRFDVTEQELRTVLKIIDRAKDKGWVAGPAAPDHWYAPTTAILDLIMVNANSCPLDFERMLEADDFNLLHDIAGIGRHVDRNTGKLTDAFTPRLAKRRA